ncbi:hypothetical protein TSMEX_000400 [Taenia solium]|eukprot:TsM_000379900 transcript=TsM_000379900 gene=TsM_000379900
MLLHSSLVRFLFLAFTSYQVSPAIVPDGETARKLEVDLFEAPDLPLDEVLAESEEDLLMDQFNKGDKWRGVLMPAGWRRFRQRPRRAFRRIGNGIRRFLRKHGDILIPIIVKGVGRLRRRAV